MAIFETLENPFIEILIVCFLGLAFGSFATALAYRIPKGLPWVTRGKSEDVNGLRSACPKCHKELGVRDLIPVFSWLLSGGKCRHCAAPISRSYPATEIASVFACLGVYAVYGLSLSVAPMYLLIPFLLALLVIDLKHLILPDQLVAIVFGLGAINTVLLAWGNPYGMGGVLAAYGGAAILYAALIWAVSAIMSKVMKKETLGFGDVKFSLAAGLWLGIPNIGVFFALSGVLGVLFGLIYQKLVKSECFPFGPALIGAFYALLLLQGSHFF